MLLASGRAFGKNRVAAPASPAVLISLFAEIEADSIDGKRNEQSPVYQPAYRYRRRWVYTGSIIHA